MGTVDQSFAAPPSPLDRLFTAIERIGDRIPDPFMLFVYLTIALAAVSTIVAASGVSVRIPGEATTIPVRGILIHRLT